MISPFNENNAQSGPEQRHSIEQSRQLPDGRPTGSWPETGNPGRPRTNCRFMFFLQVDLTGGCAAPRQSEDAPKVDWRTPISLAEGAIRNTK